MLWLDLQRELAVLAQIPWSKGRWKGEGRKGFRSPFGLTQIFWPYCLSTTFGHLFSLKLWKLLLPPNATFMRFQAGELMAFHESSGFKGPTVKGRGNCPFLKSQICHCVLLFQNGPNGTDLSASLNRSLNACRFVVSSVVTVSTNVRLSVVPKPESTMQGGPKSWADCFCDIR